MVLKYKFSRALYLRDDLTDFLEAAVRAHLEVEAIDALVAVPISLKRRLVRGYNQSVLLARALAQRLDRRYVPFALTRHWGAKTQSDLTIVEREQNAKGGYTCRRPTAVRGRTILLIDDIMTTGATFRACATALKSAGASRIWCASLARTVRW